VCTSGRTAPGGGLELPVAAIMSTRIVQAFRDIPLAAARALAARYDYNGFPVVGREGRLVGVLTKGDLLRATHAAAGGADVWAQPVSAWVARGVLALRATDSLARAVEVMVDSGLRSLPVIDQDDRVEGMVSRDDLLQALAARAEGV
jgi:CBS domain-containing protein